MAEYISKSEVVAEIKELIRANELYLSEPKTDEIRFQKTGAYSVLNDLLHFIDTLEVKEADIVEREVKEDAGGYPYIDATELYDYDNDKPLAKAGDKVKVMFIKNK